MNALLTIFSPTQTAVSKSTITLKRYLVSYYDFKREWSIRIAAERLEIDDGNLFFMIGPVCIVETAAGTYEEWEAVDWT